MTPHKAAPSVPHDEAMAGMLKADPDLAVIYLAAALEEASLPGGQFALLAAHRHINLAQEKTT
jgi:hypothetical protein